MLALEGLLYIFHLGVVMTIDISIHAILRGRDLRRLILFLLVHQSQHLLRSIVLNRNGGIGLVEIG